MSGETQKNRKEKEGDIIRSLTDKQYEYGFTTDVETEIIGAGLNEDVIRQISES